LMNPSSPSFRTAGQFVVYPPGSDVKPAILTQLENHIAQYTSRDLTYDSDALNAINAVLIEFQTRGCKLLHGIPRWLDDSNLRTEKARYKNYHFNYGLCWIHGFGPHNHHPRRRPEFPSWSWAGWTGNVTWLPMVSDQFQSSISKVLEFQYKTSSGELSSIANLHKDATFIDQEGKSLHVNALTLHLHFELAQPFTNSSIESKGLSLFLHSDQTPERIPLHLTRNIASSQDFQERLLTEIWTGLLLGYGISGT